jgi:cytochrome P450
MVIPPPSRLALLCRQVLQLLCCPALSPCFDLLAFNLFALSRYCRYIKAYFVAILAKENILIKKWKKQVQNGKPIVEVNSGLLQLTLDVIGKIGFGRDFGCQEEKDCYFIKAGEILGQEAAARSFLPRFLWHANFKRSQRFKEALGWFHEHVGKIIDEQQGPKVDIESEDGDAMVRDMLSVMVNAEDRQTGKRLSRQELVDQIVTFLFAGHETTAHTVSWVVHLLSENPEQQQRLQKEVDSVYGTKQELDFADLESLRYTRMCVLESLRLYPVLARLFRQADHDVTLAGYKVPKGSMVRISLMDMGWDERIWQDPKTFKPDRWDDDSFLPTLNPKATPAGAPPYSFMPFGTGLRSCIGKRLALVEATMVVAKIAHTFAMKPSPEHGPPEVVSDITTGPKNGCFVLMSTR